MNNKIVRIAVDSSLAVIAMLMLFNFLLLMSFLLEVECKQEKIERL